jgi:uncharacterized protein involved in outer membrane biogenesis
MTQEPSEGARRRWPWFLSATAALLFSCSLILLFLGSLYDVNNLKLLIIRIVKDMTGQELSIYGQIKLDADLTPCLVVEKVSLQNAPWGVFPAMVEAERLELEIALIPLARKKIQVKKAILIEPKFLVETEPSGMSNFSFQTTGKAPPSEGTPSVHLMRMSAWLPWRRQERAPRCPTSIQFQRNQLSPSRSFPVIRAHPSTGTGVIRREHGSNPIL